MELPRRARQNCLVDVEQHLRYLQDQQARELDYWRCLGEIEREMEQAMYLEELERTGVDPYGDL